jgi:hypothetical protein
LLEWLVQTQSLTPVLADRVARVQAETSDRLAAILLKLGLFSERRLADELSRYCELPHLDPASLPQQPVASSALNPTFLRAREIILLRTDAETLDVACWNALDDYVPVALRFASGGRAIADTSEPVPKSPPPSRDSRATPRAERAQREPTTPTPRKRRSIASRTWPATPP